MAIYRQQRTEIPSQELTIHPMSSFLACDTLTAAWQFPYYHVDAFTGKLFAGNPAGGLHPFRLSRG
jgi:hypothetical protein